MECACYSSSRGNVLFLILIAVALFAALSYAVTQSTRSGGGNAGRETAATDSAQILNYAVSLQQALTRLRISGNCTDSEISLENPIDTNYTNATAAPNNRCHLFHPNGGGVSWQMPPKSTGMTEPYFFSSYNVFFNVPNDTDCTPASECTDTLTMFLPMNNRELCLEINKRMGYEGKMAADWINQTPFDGAFGHGNAIPDDGGDMEDFIGVKTGCLEALSGMYPESSGATHFFYSVLLEHHP